MPLSLNKLESFLSDQSLIPRNFFIIDNLLVYLEVFNVENAESFMLYIPSKYKIPVRQGTNIYDIKHLNNTEDGYIPTDYAKEPDNFDLEKQYNEVDIDFNINDSVKNITKHLEENYNHPVSLKDVGKDDISHLKEIFRQLRRLKFCTQSLKYKLCIMFKNYICYIHRDDTIEGFSIKNFKGSTERKIMVNIDIETLYEKINSLSIDIKTVIQGVYRILDKNQGKHINNLHKMLEQKNNLVNFSDTVSTKKIKYISYLDQLENLLTFVNKNEKDNIEKIREIEDHYSRDSSVKGIHNDIERTHQVAKYETELKKNNKVKQEILENILKIKAKHQNLSLSADNICFDNLVMIDTIIKNFISLSEI